jgi:hypothetical protein
VPDFTTYFRCYLFCSVSTTVVPDCTTHYSCCTTQQTQHNTTQLYTTLHTVLHNTTQHNTTHHNTTHVSYISCVTTQILFGVRTQVISFICVNSLCYLLTLFGSWASVVSVVTKYGLDVLGIVVRSPAEASYRTFYGTFRASYSMDISGSLVWGKAAGMISWPLTSI